MKQQKPIFYGGGGKFLHLVLFVIIAYLFSCKTDNNGYRSEEERTTLRNITDSIEQMAPNALRLCDSMMTQAKDSFTFYDYFLLKGKHYLISESNDTSLHFSAKTKAFAEKQPESPRRNGLLAKSLAIEAATDYVFRRNNENTIKTNYNAYLLAMRSDIIDFSPEIAANLADAYTMANNLPEAAKWYRRALFLVDSLQLPERKNISLYMGLAQIYTNLEDFTSAEYFYKQTDKHFDRIKLNMQLYFLNNFGNMYYYKKDYPKALEVFKRMENHLHANKCNNIIDVYLCRINLADVYLNLDSTEAALKYINDAEDFFIKKNILPAIHYVNTIKIGTAIKEKRYDEVERIMNKEKHERKIKEQNLINIRDRYLTEYYKATDNYKKAYEIFSKATAASDSAMHNKMGMRASEIMQKFTEDTLKLNHAIEISKKDADLYKTSTTLWLMAFVVLLLSTCLGASVVYTKNKKATAQIKMLNLKMENIRQRITPHFVFNILNAEIGKQNNEQKTDGLYKLSRLIRANLDLSCRMYITLSEELDFVQRFVELKNSMLDNKIKFSMNIDSNVEPDKIMIPSMFIQLLVENSIKHGFKNTIKEKRLDINISGRPRGTIIAVTDNGTGFDIRNFNNKTGKNGLDIIRKTIMIINQDKRENARIKMNIQNVKNGNEISGCTVELYIPQKIKLTNII